MSTPLPVRGELWWAYLDPVVGTEQGGRRPVLVVSRDEYNGAGVGRVIVVSITTKDRNWPTAIKLDADSGVSKDSWALVDQIRAIDLARLKRRIGNVSVTTMASIDDTLRRLLRL